MPDYRRWYIPGGMYFFTVVTWARRPIFADDDARQLLGNCFRRVRERAPFQIPAVVVLPDHVHCVWTLPPGDDRYSLRWSEIKRRFSIDWPRSHRVMSSGNRSRVRRGERYLWQRRFWEHWIRDTEELGEIFDYIHYNPVKHGYVTRPGDWAASSYRRYQRAGLYPQDWGQSEPSIHRLKGQRIE